MMNYRSQLNRIQGRHDQIRKDREDMSRSLMEAQRHLTRLEQAQLIGQQVAKQTQEEIEMQITSLVTSALDTVFPDPYEVKLNFTIKRGRTEAEIEFHRDGATVSPMEASGGGVIDLAAFAFRISLWVLGRPRRRPLMVMDEPFRYLAKDLLPQAGELLKQLSDRLGIQFIIITHGPQIASIADKVFRCNRGNIEDELQ